MPTPPTIDHLIACPECGVVHQFQKLPPKTHAHCQRCGTTLYRYHPHWQNQSWALWLTSSVLFIISNSFPLFMMRTQGMMQELTIIRAVNAFWHSDLYLISVLLALNLLILPLLELMIVGWVLLTLTLQWQAHTALLGFRLLQEFKPWGMLEVFMLGTIVALVKLGDLASLVMEVAFVSFSLQMVVIALLNRAFEPFWVWRALGQLKQAHYQS
ncbi:MAG: paraquat-inducible protein A [Thiofilum sp.]|uniref:paraquat-inducible protein A n=1 Tax=Thiofilum sp. TaxID=2212733 RepID=UPI0025F52885|nr:paraquat-inducible protein A [Thiofilum sp.]MBK8454125.1 paraquat-inducible protein A [Thiofilum sp.]